MTTQNIEKSAATSNQPRRSRTTPRSHYRSRSLSPHRHIPPSHTTKSEFHYIGQLSDWERVDLILKRMYAEHRWTIKDLLYHMVIEEPEKKYGRTKKKRINDLDKAVFGQPKVVGALDGFRNHQMESMNKEFRKEILRLQAQPGFDKFNARTDPKDINMEKLVDQAREIAPSLWHFLKGLVETSGGNERLFANIDGALFMICVILTHYNSPLKSNNFHVLLGLHLHSMGVKRRTINLLAGLGFTSTYKTILSYRDSVAHIGQSRLKRLAQTSPDTIIVSWDNFDYNETVRHLTLREQPKHISATTGKFCIAHYVPDGGLLSSMFHPEVQLAPRHVRFAPGNLPDNVSIQCQRYWIAEAIRYTHRVAVESIFAASPSSTNLVGYPEFPSVERLYTRKTPHFGLSPIQENEGTIQGTYQVIDKIFLHQFGLDPSVDFAGRLYLVYGDQKTVSLIGSVKRERKYSRDTYGQYRWVLPIPGLFHWRTNFLDMIYDIYSGSECSDSSLETTLLHNQRYMGCVQGHKSPFHHKEEVATRAFDARVTAMFYQCIHKHCLVNDRSNVDRYVAKLSRSSFLEHVEFIRAEVFSPKILTACDTDLEVDHTFVAHCRFIHQVETYKSLKYAIKHADIGIIERIFARSCLLFHGAKKSKYAFLSLYMTWLTQTDATSHELRTALLANGLVNIRGAADSWFEMDRLNEFFNLHMRDLMATRRTSTQTPHDLFRRTALTASYCSDLKSELENSFGEYSNGRHHVKDASEDVFRLGYELFKTRSVRKHTTGRDSAFKPADILSLAAGGILFDSIEKFNESQFVDEVINDASAAPIAGLDDIIGEGSDGDE